MKALKKIGIRLAAAFLRNRRSEFGRYRLTQTFLPLLREYGSEMGVTIVRTRHGFRLKVHLDDWLGQYVYLTGSYEPGTARLFEHLVSVGDGVLDVGANIGFFSLLSATRAGAGGSVVAFEPAPRARQRLHENIDLNQLRNVTVLAVCASDAPGTVTLYEGPKAHTGISSMRPIGEGANAVTVDAQPVDDLIERIPPIRLVKIDVEGAELMALRGMEGLIARDNPFLIIEVTDTYLKAFGHDARQLTGWLGQRAYRLYRIADEGLVEVSADGPVATTQFNMLCVPDAHRAALPPHFFARS